MVSCLGNEHHFDGFKFFNRLGRWPMNDCNLEPLQWEFAGAEAVGSSKEGNIVNRTIKFRHLKERRVQLFSSGRPEPNHGSPALIFSREVENLLHHSQLCFG